MRTKREKLSEEEIDRAVIAQAEDDSAWDKPVKAKRAKSASFMLPAVLATRAAFLARLHRESSLEDWLRRIIQERIDIEEAAFTGLKKELLAKNSR